MKTLRKYRMIYDDTSFCETLDITEAENSANYIIIDEEVEDEIYENAKLIYPNVILTN